MSMGTICDRLRKENCFFASKRVSTGLFPSLVAMKKNYTGFLLSWLRVKSNCLVGMVGHAFEGSEVCEIFECVAKSQF